MTGEYKYLSFIELNQKPKTKVFAVKNKLSDGHLGNVYWHAPWRKYCFFPIPYSIFDAACLADIQDFINKLMLERRKK